MDFVSMPAISISIDARSRVSATQTRSVVAADAEESTMNWEQRFCPSQFCTPEGWMVQRDPATREVWWVAAHVGDRPFTIAATDPVCPRCGTTLRTRVELEGRLDQQVGAIV